MEKKTIWLSILGVSAIALFSKGASAASIAKVKSITKFDPFFQKAGLDNGIDWKMLKTIAMVESTLGENPRVKKGLLNPNDIIGSMSEDGKSWGLMQLTVPTARDYDKTATEVKLNYPEYSIGISAKLLAMLNRIFKGNERDIIMAYNQGLGNQRKFIQMEKDGTLKPHQFPAAKNYYEKYKKNKKILFS